MANINHLEMAAAFAALPQIEIKKSLLGFKTNIIYTPTHSKIHIIQEEYDTNNGKALQEIILADSEHIKDIVTKSNITKASIGNVRLDACISEDNQFVAVQLLHFVDLTYAPVTEMKVFEGDIAEVIAKVIRH